MDFWLASSLLGDPWLAESLVRDLWLADPWFRGPEQVYLLQVTFGPDASPQGIDSHIDDYPFLDSMDSLDFLMMKVPHEAWLCSLLQVDEQKEQV